MIVKDVMRTDFASIPPNATLEEAAKIMLNTGTETLFVLQDNQLVGVIDIRDLFTTPIPASFGTPMIRQEEEILTRKWRTATVEPLMNPYVIKVKEDCPLMVAAEIMVNRGKHPIAVVMNESLIGVIDRADIIRALLAAKEALLETTD